MTTVEIVGVRERDVDLLLLEEFIASPQFLETSGITSLFGLRLDTAIVEKPVVLDNEKAPSMTDLMGYARNAAGNPVILAVEGKAQEAFGLPVRSWLRGDALEPPVDATPRKSRTRRFDFLCARLGLGVDLECVLRYQLLHRTVSAVMEAELHAAAAAVVIVHAFGATSAANWNDFERFLEALNAGPAAPGKVTSPVRVGSQRSTETCFLWWQDPFHTPTA